MAAGGRLCARGLTSVQKQACRAFGIKPKVLEEEERAIENVYIQKMERERLEKLKKKRLKDKQGGVEASKGETASGNNPSEPESRPSVG